MGMTLVIQHGWLENPPRNIQFSSMILHDSPNKKNLHGIFQQPRCHFLGYAHIEDV